MRVSLFLATATTIIASSVSGFAQEAGAGNAHAGDPDFHMGVGAGLSLLSPVIVGGGTTLFAGPFGGGSIVLPMDIAGVIRVEPELGLFHYGEGDNVSSTSATSAKVAAGIFYMFGIGGNAQGNVGARFGPQIATSTNETDNAGATINTTRTSLNFAAGPAFSGEYFPSEYFSIGVEAQLNFVFLGEDTIDVDPGADPGGNDETGLAAHTNAVIYARAFFL